MEKNKKNPCGAAPRTPQRDPQNLCLQGKWMPLTLHLAIVKHKKCHGGFNMPKSHSLDWELTRGYFTGLWVGGSGLS